MDSNPEKFGSRMDSPKESDSRMVSTLEDFDSRMLSTIKIWCELSKRILTDLVPEKFDELSKGSRADFALEKFDGLLKGSREDLPPEKFYVLSLCSLIVSTMKMWSGVMPKLISMMERPDMITSELRSIISHTADLLPPDHKEDEENVAPHKTFQPDDEDEEDEFTDTEFTKSSMEDCLEEMDLDAYRSLWEYAWGGQNSLFVDMTLLSPMYFTHCTPQQLRECAAFITSTLQIYSINVTEIKGGLQWPLYVYGLVAARDSADYNRNLLFCCAREECQKLTQQDPFLRLTGPSRAIVGSDPVNFEIQIKVKGRTKSRDRTLFSRILKVNHGFSDILFDNRFCTLKLGLQRIEKTVQATILSVRVVKADSWPFEHGGRIVCSSPPQDEASRQVVLLDSHEPMDWGEDGELDLSRHVVSVELKRDADNFPAYKKSLKFVIQTYDQSGAIATEGDALFSPKRCNISQGVCQVGESMLEIIIAWSLLVDKGGILTTGWVDSFDGMKLGYV